MPPVQVFATDAHREAAAAIVATVNLAHTAPGLLTEADQSGLAQLYRDLDLDPLDVVVGASVIVTKLLADERVVWGVNPATTVARMGAWVAADELGRL